MKRLFTLILLLFCTSSMLAQNISFNQGKIKQKHYLHEIPYQEIEGFPVVSVTINGKIYKFLFDTGAAGLLISDNVCKESNLPIVGNVMVIGASGEREAMRKILLPALHLQKITFTNIPGIVFHEDSKTLDCLGFDGIIGGNMLKHFVVQFDEQNKQIIITNHIKNLALQTNVCQKMELCTDDRPFVSVVLQKEQKRVYDKVLFDSGFRGFYALSSRCYNWEKTNNIVEKLSEAKGFFHAGIHDFYTIQNHLLLNIPTLIVAQMRFNDVPVTTTHDENSRIGAKLLQYGKVTLDYKKKRFYFESYEDINISKVFEAPWTVQFSFQNDRMVVGVIWDKALESQINLGDEVLSINGIDLKAMDFCELLQFENLITGDKLILELKDITTDETKKATIKRVQLSE